MWVWLAWFRLNLIPLLHVLNPPNNQPVDAKPHTDLEEIKAILAKQVTSPVQWETTMNNLVKDGIGTAYELGPGKVCAGILKRIDRGATMVNIEV